MTLGRLSIFWLAVSFAAGSLEAWGQIDPVKRRLIQLGYNQPIEGRGPIAGYGFYYHNQPNFPATNQTLRLAIAPIYVDSELGFSGLLGPATDLAVGLSGGGFADSYAEVRQGNFFEDQSFIGHGVSAASSVYHTFNPGKLIPLFGILRGAVHQTFYVKDSDTAPNFQLPDDITFFNLRSGLRWGGLEPSLTEPWAMELSAWYELQVRDDAGPYGFNGDRSVERTSQLFWARGLIKYMFESEHWFDVTLTAGTSIDADRFSAYRLGGVLPFVSEFPLSLPGYYFQELSAKQFVLLNGGYSFPLTPSKNWRLNLAAAGAVVDYLPGFQQSGDWHSGIGAGITYISPRGSWLTTLVYGHGFQAIRNDGRGANQVGILFQYDFDAKQRGKSRFFIPGLSPYRSRGGERLFR